MDNPLWNRLSLRSGGLRDYQALACYHYHTKPPGTMDQIWVLEDQQACFYAGQPKQVVGVLITSYPALACKMRDVALGDWLSEVEGIEIKAMLINEMLRVISRVIIHPQWRGLGLAVRLVRHALQNARTPYTEALATMGSIHPFFEKAGMTAYPRPKHPHDQRLLQALHTTGLAEQDILQPQQAKLILDTLPLDEQRWLQQEITHWQRARQRPAKPTSQDLVQQLKDVRPCLMRPPVYYLYQGAKQDD